MQTLSIEPVRDDKALQEFITLPWDVYKDDPFWVPPLLSERKTFYDRARHPFHKHADIEYFVARRDGRAVGTIAAIVNHRHNEFHNERCAFFGSFEVLPDPEAARALLDAACDWAKQRGMEVLRGPATFSSNEEWGLLVDGFDSAPVILTTYNPRYFVEYIETAGFHKAMDLYAYETPSERLTADALPPKLIRAVELIRKRSNVELRSLDMRRFDEEARHVKRIYNSAWAKNWGFVPLTDEEFDRLASDLKQVLDPDLTLFASINGETVGFSIPLPDVSQALRLAYPNPRTPEWVTLAKLLWHWKVRPKVDTLRMFALGVLPEYRYAGIDALFYYESALVGLAKGYRRAEFSWALESNTMINRMMTLMGGEIYKTWRIYERPLID
ncbi:MAG: GNAT family N-acetyltransferase [Anaerolineales bacterium]